jgi:hypothetical protein
MKSQTSIKNSSRRTSERFTSVLQLIGKFGHAALVAGFVFMTTVASPAADITYVGSHIGIEADTNSATDGGWRTPSTPKPLDVDGDSIYGTDGYWFAGTQLKPSYVSAFTNLFQNNNSAGGWAAWDKPDASGDQEYPYLRDGAAGVFPDTIVQFAITGTGLDGKVLRVGCYGTLFAHTQKYTITQTAGTGSGVASSPVIAFSGNTMDGVFFDITGATDGDTFVVSIDGGGSEAMCGITFDTAVANPPGIPSGLSATPGDGRVDLAWSASSGANSYEVKRSTTQGGPYSTVGSPATPSYADTTVTNGTPYYYVVSAVNTFGTSADSGEVSATPTASTPPLAPTGLAATAGNSQVDLSWNASGNTNSYNVKRGTTQGGPYSVIGTPPGTSFTDSTAVNGTTYYYVVSASNAFGESPDSGEASATPAPPTSISYVGDHIGIEDDTNSPTDGGWRTPSTPKPMDVDGDGIYGTDGYWFAGLQLKPSYVSAFTTLYENNNSAGGWADWDNPDGTADQAYPYLRSGSGSPDNIVQFTITGTGLDGKVLRVGAYGTVWPHTQSFTITQTAGVGSGPASSPSIAFTGATMDGVFFDIINATAGDTFVVSIDGGGSEAMAGITFDTASSAARITSFEAAGATGVINQGAKTIALTVPFGTDLATLAPTFTLTSGTCNQTSGAAPSPNFATQNPVNYTVTDTDTDPDTVNTYSVTVTVAPEIATLVINLGTSPAGTTIEGGTFIGSGPTNLPLPALPGGSILQSIAINSKLEATDNDNYASDLSLLLDPTPGTPGGDFSVEITNGSVPLGGAALDLNWPTSADAGVGTDLIDTKTAADWAAAGSIDLGSTGLFLGNSYGGPTLGGTWSGTITLTYVVGSGVGSSYSTWSGGESFAGDANNDGVPNGLAFLLGAATPGTAASGKLPTVSQSGGDLVMEFDCLATAARGGSVLNLQYDGDLLAPWTSVPVPGAVGNTTVGNVSFVATANGSLIHIVATIDDAAEAAAGKLFGRLQGTE